MAQVSYKKRSILKLFSIKIFDFTTDYYERSTDKDDDENKEYIELQKRTIDGGM